MGFFDSTKTEQGVQLIWLQHDKEKMLPGRLLLEEAVREGDKDAGAFLSQTAQNSTWIWPFSKIEVDSAAGNAYLRESVFRGSHYGVAGALLWDQWTPALERGMAPDTAAKAWVAVKEVANAGEPLHQFLWACACLKKLSFPQGFVPPAHPDTDGILWLEKSLASGLTLAGGRLLYLYHYMPCKEEDAQRVLDICAATGAPAWEENKAIWLFAQGREAEGFRWACKAADHGQISAWTTIGQSYLTGQGVTASPSQGFICLELGAKNGHALAQRVLAWLYFKGEYVPRDHARAAYWAGCASEAPEGEQEYAFPLLAHCMLHGLGVPKDTWGAVRLIDRALKFNITASGVMRYGAEDSGLLYCDAGEICEKGIGTKRGSISRAVKAYKIADDLGEAMAAARLASFKKGLFGRWHRK